MKNHYPRFNRMFLTTTFSIVLGISACNFVVDPYGVMNSPIINGLNKLKPTKANHIRLFKAIDVIRIKPKIIFLGTSRANLGLDPRHPVFSNEDRESIYNLGLQDANMYELKRYFQHALTNQTKLKKVVIGIDYLSFNELLRQKPDFDETILEKQKMTSQLTMSLLFSLDAFISSQKTIIENLFNGDNDPKFINGMRLIESTNLPGSSQYFTNGFEILAQAYKKYKLSEERLNDLQIIVETCKERGIDIVIFVSPVHASQLETIRAAGKWENFEQWKREVSKIAPFWDFSGYNSITTEALADEMKNYKDSSHYKPEVGNLVLNRIFNYHDEVVPEDFGVPIAPENIESHLKKIRADREAWAKNNQTTIRLVQDLIGLSEKLSKGDRI